MRGFSLKKLMLVALFGTSLAVVRIDRSSPFDYEFSAIHATAPLGTSVRKALAAGEEPFQFQFQCSATPEICQMAEQGFKNAGSRIAQVLQISVPIRIKASFENLCSTPGETCSILGAAVAAAEFPIKKDGMTLMMPQSLIKQLKIEGPALKYRDVDILAMFNSRASWYFRDDESTRLPQNYDFELVAAHEIMHGLGFASGLIDLSSVQELKSMVPTSEKFLVPALYFNDPFTATTKSLVSTFKPINIYDYYVRGDTQKYSDIATRVAQFPKQRSSISELISRFIRSDTFQASKEWYRLASSGIGRVWFQVPDGDRITLFTPTRYAQGSTGSHLDMVANSSADFLMVPALTPGRTIEQLMTMNSNANANEQYFFGPNIMSVFETIGWATKRNPNVQSVVVDTEFEKNGAMRVMGSLWLLVLFML